MTEQVLTQQQPQDQECILSQELSATYTKVLVQDWDTFQAVLDTLDHTNLFCYDTETNGKLDRFEVQLVGISICADEDTAFYIPLGHHQGEQLDLLEVIEALRYYWEAEEYEKICHNTKFDEMVLSQYGINFAGPGHDTIVMAWMLAPDSPPRTRGLKTLVKAQYGVQMETYQDVITSTKKQKNVDRDFSFAPVSLAHALEYGADDAYWDYKLFIDFRAEMQKRKLWAAYENVERPFTRVIRHLEARGVHMDQELIKRADTELPQLIEQVEAEIYEAAGEVFNIGSPPQLGQILFGKLGIGNNVPKSKKTGNFVTDKDTLKLYAGKNKIVSDVLRRKKIKKTHSTFVEGAKKFIAKDGKIHPQFNGCGTATGRLSGSKPNLQQVEGDEVEGITIRNFFIPSPGHKFVVADYGQIEYRIMAHLSKDKAMLEAFAAGHDFHAETARKVFNVPAGEEVIHRQRFIAKSINFGIGYGRGPKSLAETLECSLDDAKDYIADYYVTFAGLGAYKQHVVEQTRKLGYVTTLTGRKRYLPLINANSWSHRGHAERQAFNTKIQGSAADLIKLAMISLEPKLLPYKACMCIQIHDELVIECPDEHTGAVSEVVAHTMRNPVKGKNPLILPLAVDPKIVERWGDAK